MFHVGSELEKAFEGANTNEERQETVDDFWMKKGEARLDLPAAKRGQTSAKSTRDT